MLVEKEVESAGASGLGLDARWRDGERALELERGREEKDGDRSRLGFEGERRLPSDLEPKRIRAIVSARGEGS